MNAHKAAMDRRGPSHAVLARHITGVNGIKQVLKAALEATAKHMQSSTSMTLPVSGNIQYNHATSLYR